MANLYKILSVKDQGIFSKIKEKGFEIDDSADGPRLNPLRQN